MSRSFHTAIQRQKKMMPLILYVQMLTDNTSPPLLLLLCVDNLELLGLMSEEVGISLGNDLALIRLLHKILVPLLVSKVDSILLGLELYPMTIHEISG